jgi:ABC-2 type transport system ATP-binding protein
MLEVEGLTKTYGDFSAVRDLSFTAGPGELLGLVGPNGAGKTTTLRCLAGIFPPTSGHIRIAGYDLLAEPIAAKRETAFFSDEPRLFDHLTARQHLNFTARIYQVAGASEKIPRLLDRFELSDKAEQLPGGLASGAEFFGLCELEGT